MTELIEDDWSVENVETSIGTGSIGFTANLLYKGKKVAEVEDLGNGEKTLIYWSDINAARLSQKIEATHPKVDVDPDNPGKYTVKYDFSIMVFSLITKKLVQ